MVAAIVMTVVLVGMLCVLAYTLATYALPFMLALAAARFAYETGAGCIGAGFVGLVAGMVSFGVLSSLFAATRAPILRITIALIFAACGGRRLCSRAWRCGRVRAVSDVAGNLLRHWRARHRALGAGAIGCARSALTDI